MATLGTADLSETHNHVGEDGCRRNIQVDGIGSPVSSCTSDRPPPGEIFGACEKRRESSASECSVDVDLERGVSGVKAFLAKEKRDCRICQLSLDLTNQESGFPIELGCSCKEDLAAAHKQCAEAWFKIKGNKTCEICGSIALNVVGANDNELMEQWNEASETPVTVAPPAQPAETQRFWQGHRFLNFLLGCMVFAFVISWLFHFNVPS